MAGQMSRGTVTTCFQHTSVRVLCRFVLRCSVCFVVYVCYVSAVLYLCVVLCLCAAIVWCVGLCCDSMLCCICVCVLYLRVCVLRCVCVLYLCRCVMWCHCVSLCCFRAALCPHRSAQQCGRCPIVIRLLRRPSLSDCPTVRLSGCPDTSCFTRQGPDRHIECHNLSAHEGSDRISRSPSLPVTVNSVLGRFDENIYIKNC